MMKIIITTGFSGGHTYPALAFGTFLAQRHPEIEVIYIASERARKQGKMLDNIHESRVIYFHDAPFSYRQLLKCIFINIKAFHKAFKILQYEKPCAVVGFGSYLSFPLLIVAQLLKIKTIIHEQNVTFGKANRILSVCASIGALSFEGTYHAKNKIVTGNLLRESILDIASRTVSARTNTQKNVYNILVLGGSQGASAINRLLFDLADSLKEVEKESLRFILISGERDRAQANERLEAAGVQFIVFSFTDDIALLYEKADIVIARAGSGVVFECLAFGIPAIFIPYPHAGSHQNKNAAYVEDHGAALTLQQKGLSAEKLKEKMLGLLKEPKKLEIMSHNALAIRKIEGCRLLEGALFSMLETESNK